MENFKEEWKEIKENTNYLVSNTGKVYSKLFKQEMYLRKKSGGYWVVRLSKNDKKYERSVSRLVALAFIPNPENKKEVNHIDENKDNNYVTNLEWVTSKENINHGTRNKRVSDKISKAVIQMTLEGLFTKEYKSAYQARKDGFSFSQITKVCKGIYTHHKGFKWKYK